MYSILIRLLPCKLLLYFVAGNKRQDGLKAPSDAAVELRESIIDDYYYVLVS